MTQTKIKSELIDKYLYNLVEPRVLYDKLNELKDKLPGLLENYNKYFLLFKKINNSENESYFEENLTQLKQLNKDIDTLIDNTEINLTNLNKKLNSISKLIEEEKEKDSFFSFESFNYMGINKSSNELYFNYKELIKYYYMQIFFIILGIFIFIIVIYKLRIQVNNITNIQNTTLQPINVVK